MVNAYLLELRSTMQYKPKWAIKLLQERTSRAFNELDAQRQLFIPIMHAINSQERLALSEQHWRCEKHI